MEPVTETTTVTQLNLEDDRVNDSPGNSGSLRSPVAAAFGRSEYHYVIPTLLLVLSGSSIKLGWTELTLEWTSHCPDQRKINSLLMQISEYCINLNQGWMEN